MSATHRIDIQCIGHNANGLVWRVTHAGEVIIAKTRLPALDASRHLQNLSITGRLVVYRGN